MASREANCLLEQSQSRTIPKDEVPKYDSISKVAKDMPDPTFGVDIYAEADADKTEAANILTSFLRHPMIDYDLIKGAMTRKRGKRGNW